jgi:CTP:molybdopterin cytidylyltransferase MocA
MTVAAVILAASPEAALRDVEGIPSARRLADTAWAGGATPIVIVAADPDGAVAAALAGTPAVVVAPVPLAGGPAGQVCRGIDVARAEVEGTDAALVWPARMGWVDAETVTSLIEAHGVDRRSILRPAYAGAAGWPALVPVEHLAALRALDPSLDAGAAIAALVTAAGTRLLEVGDPGATHDLGTPRAALPPFEGPPEPPSGHHHEWGSAAAAGPDEAPDPAPTIP